jgi:hypothetical protein
MSSLAHGIAWGIFISPGFQPPDGVKVVVIRETRALDFAR